MFGQILTGLAQPFVLAAPTRYSDLWFTGAGRVAATAIMSLANPFGGALGQLIDPFWVNTPSDIPNMVLYVSIIVCIPPFGTLTGLTSIVISSNDPVSVYPLSTTNTSNSILEDNKTTHSTVTAMASPLSRIPPDLDPLQHPSRPLQLHFKSNKPNPITLLLQRN